MFKKIASLRNALTELIWWKKNPSALEFHHFLYFIVNSPVLFDTHQ